MTYGLTGYFTMKTNQALSPIKDALNEQTVRGNQVAQLHQTTLTTMQTRMSTLTTSANASGMTMAWQGAGANSMNASFGDISQFLNQLNDQIQNNGQQAILNRTFLQVLEFTGELAKAMVVLDVLLVIVNAVILLGSAAFAGVGALAGAAIDTFLDTGVLALEANILLALLAGDALAWLLGTLLIYAISHPWNPSATSPGITILYTTKTAPDGRRVRVRELSPGEVKKLRTEEGEKFHDIKGKHYGATDVIYKDLDTGEYWIGAKGSDNVEMFP